MADKAAYQQWLESAEKVQSIAADNSLELWQKAHRVNEAYAGLALEGLLMIAHMEPFRDRHNEATQ